MTKLEELVKENAQLIVEQSKGALRLDGTYDLLWSLVDGAITTHGRLENKFFSGELQGSKGRLQDLHNRTKDQVKDKASYIFRKTEQLKKSATKEQARECLEDIEWAAGYIKGLC